MSKGMEPPAINLPLFHGTGVMPGVELSDSASLLDLVEEEHGPAWSRTEH